MSLFESPFETLFQRFWKSRLAAFAFEGAQATGWWRDMYRELIDVALATGPAIADASSALDVGCGEGLGTRILAERFRRVVGVDISEHMVSRSRAHAAAADVTNAEYRTADATSLPFADDSFDMVTATSVVYLTADSTRTLAEMGRVCRPDGRVASFDPSPRLTLPRALGGVLRGEICGRAPLRATLFLIGWVAASRLNHRFSPADMTRMLSAAHLRVEHLETRHRGMVLFTIGRPQKRHPPML